MSSPAVTVVIPTYNRAGSIVAAVQSVLRQTYDDLEVIVVDDCSTDDTIARLEALDAPRLRVVRQPRNAGANAARNAGVAAARGTLIAFQDSDDEWLPRKLELQCARLAQTPEAVGVFCGMIVLDDRPHGARATPRYIPDPGLGEVDGEILQALLRGSFISTQTFMAPATILRKAGDFDETLPALQDWDLMLRIARLGQISLVDEPLVIQRFSSDSITRSARKRVMARIRIVEKNMDALRARPRLLAEHYHAIAGGCRLVGAPRAARRWLRLALRLDPGRPRSVAALATVSVQGVFSAGDDDHALAPPA